MGLGRDQTHDPWVSNRTCWGGRGLRKYFVINLHESMGFGQDQTYDPWISNQTCYGARLGDSEVKANISSSALPEMCKCACSHYLIMHTRSLRRFSFA